MSFQVETISVLNTITNNAGDYSIDDAGNLNIAGLNTMPAGQWTPGGITKMPYLAEQIQKTRLTFTSSNSTQYTFTINGYSIQYGSPKQATINWTSTASNTTALTSAAITALINAVTDFTVSATDTGSGVVDLAGHTTTYFATKGVGPIFDVQNTDTKLTISAPLTVAFSAAPTGGRTATGRMIVPDNGTLSTTVNAALIIDDPGEGYIAAPTFTFAGGEGASAAATAYIFEGRVTATKFSAGSSYDTRVGIMPQGTVAAIQAKYAYLAPGVNNPSASSLTGLSALVAGNTYDEWDFNYTQVEPGSNSSVGASTSTVGQALLVYTGYTTVTTTGSCANILTLNSYWGALQNLKQGYKVNIYDSGASNTIDDVTAATGAFLLVAGGSPALGAVSLGMKCNDTIAIGTAAPIVADTTGVVMIGVVTDNLTGFMQFGISTISANSTTNGAVYKYVKRTAISQ